MIHISLFRSEISCEYIKCPTATETQCHQKIYIYVLLAILVWRGFLPSRLFRNHPILNPFSTSKPFHLSAFPPAPWRKLPREQRQRSAVKSTSAAKMKRRGCPIDDTPGGGGMVILSRLLFCGQRHIGTLKRMYTSSCFGWIWKFDSLFNLFAILECVIYWFFISLVQFLA